MKKLTIYLMLAFVVVFGCLSVARADFTGIYMFTMDGNDSNTPEAELEKAIDEWFNNQQITHDPVDLNLYTKVEAKKNGNSLMTVTYDDNGKGEFWHGTWTTAEDIEFYSVKGANQFAFYWIEDGASAGHWSTKHVATKTGNQPSISHLSAWNGTGTVVANGTISGIVTDSNCIPIPDVKVKLWHKGTMVETLTNVNGCYLFNGLEDGLYRIVARKGGYNKDKKTGIIRHLKPWGKDEFINLVLE